MARPCTRRQGKIEQHGNQHTTHSGNDGQQSLAKAGELTHQHLALDFQSDGEKEDRHQGVIDERHQSERLSVMAEQVETAYLQRDRVTPEGVIGIRPGRVGNYHGKHGNNHQHHTTVDAVFQETQE